MRQKMFAGVVAAVVAVAMAGCTFPSRGTVYDRGQTGRTMHVETGDVIAVNEVVIAGEKSAIGVSGGGFVGYAVASTAGKGTGSLIAGAVGAVGGAIAGAATEEAVTRKRAQEVSIRMSDGTTIVVVQEVKDGAFSVGEHVQVLSGGYGTTLKHSY